MSACGRVAVRYLLLLVVAAYALAAACPAPGLWVKQGVVAEVGGMTLTVPMVLLGVLLFHASIGASAGDLGAVLRRPTAVLLGAGLNVVVPFAFVVGLRHALIVWHDPQEADYLVAGLAVVAAMPVAGSSTAWSHSAGGNVALSLGLVVVTTFLSPVTTPLVMAGVGRGTGGVAVDGAGGVLLAAVVVPSALGLLVGWAVGDRAAGRWKPELRAANAGVLLVLCYSNAAAALPQVVARPDWDYLTLVVGAVTGLSMVAFG